MMKKIKKIRDDRMSDQLRAAQAANPNSSLFGLEALPDSAAARNIILSDRDVSRFIDANYSKYPADHSDDLSRAALLDHKPPGGDNIVSIAGR
jgi:hypothetical protein